VPAITKRPKARSDLIELWSYIAEDSETRADAFIDRIDKTFDTLAANPRMGRVREELADGLRSFPVGKYVVFYRISSTGVDIVRVLHSARDIDTGFSPVEE
jgi:toxin ParE1/3/4